MGGSIIQKNIPDGSRGVFHFSHLLDLSSEKYLAV